MNTSGLDTTSLAVEAVRRTTGLRIAVNAGRGPAITLAVTANRRTHRFQPEVKNTDRFATPALLAAGGQGREERILLVAPYITREIAQYCREIRMPFIDTAGNAFIETPDMFVFVSGLPKPEVVPTARFRALNPSGMRVAFALLCQPALLQANYREIARQAGVALGTVGPVMKDLAQRRYLRHLKQSKPELLNAERLVEEWVTHYPVALRPKLHGRRFQADPNRLGGLDLTRFDALWGGESAADRLTRYLKPQHYTIYSRGPFAKLVASGRMSANPAGNVEILEQFWRFEPEPGHRDLVPAILVYADLLATNEPRNVETAHLIHEQRIAPALRKAG